MGCIIYGSGIERRLDVDDRTLAHVKAVVVMKLRRNESFLLSWQWQSQQGRRISLWMHPAIPLQFELDTLEPIELNRAWLEELMVSTNSRGDLDIGMEPQIEDHTHEARKPL